MNPKLLLCLALVLSGKCYSAIIYPMAPDGGWQIVSNHLDPQSLKFLGVLRIQDLTIANPCGAYSCPSGTNLLSGQWLSGTKLYAWRYFLMHGTNGVGAMELNADEKRGKLLEFNSLEKTGLVNETLEALRKAEELPQVKKQDYEFRYLDIAPVLFRAAWLHGKSDDIIIPLPPTWGRWNAYQPYSESEMTKLLKPEAENRLKQNPHLTD